MILGTSAQTHPCNITGIRGVKPGIELKINKVKGRPFTVWAVNLFLLQQKGLTKYILIWTILKILLKEPRFDAQFSYKFAK
jgi:hypothetical protein